VSDGGDQSEAATPRPGEPRPSIATQIRLAAGFLTILPVLVDRRAAYGDVAASFGWFPLIGFAIGAAVAAESFVLGYIWGRGIGASLVVMTLVIVTGALHLDGLADTADALGAGRDRDRALAILRDSRIGTFGASALFFVLVLKILAIAGMPDRTRYAALWLAPGLARWTMVALAERLDYLRTAGAGTTLLARDRRRNFMIASTIAIVAALPIIGDRALRGYLAAAVVTFALGLFYRKWLGGVTGDLLGAASELAETAILIAMTG